MKILKPHFLTALAIALFAISVSGQTRSFGESCYWSIGLAPQNVNRLKGDDMDLGVAQWDSKFDIIKVLCFETKLKDVKTSADSEIFVATYLLDLVKKGNPDAVVVSKAPLTVDGYSGHIYSLNLDGKGAKGEVRVITREKRGYAMIGIAKDAQLLKVLQKVFEGFRTKE